jgi:hypothetical protein
VLSKKTSLDTGMAETKNVKLRDFNNPYVFIEESDGDGLGTGAPLKATGPSGQMTMPLTEPRPDRVLPDDAQTRHPYENISDDDDLPKSMSSFIGKGLSRKDFEVECRRIFVQYIPKEEKNLRAHHRDFIARNAAKLPTIRQRLVSELKKYDLSDIRGARSHFNKEDPFSYEKLVRIELEADIKE